MNFTVFRGLPDQEGNQRGMVPDLAITDQNIDPNILPLVQARDSTAQQQEIERRG